MFEPKRDPTEVRVRNRFQPNSTLEDLAIRDIEIGLKDLSCFREMPRLLRLTIVGSKTLTSLKGLESCSQLQQLHIKSCPNLRNVDAIEELAFLEELSITYSHVEVDPIPVLACKNLIRLDLSGLHAFKDLQFLNQLQKLELLKISDSGARSLIGLDRLVSLQELEVKGSELETIGCEVVSASIEEIDFGDCCFLIDLNGIENIPSLSAVNVSQCDQLRNINGLIGLPSLQLFDWADCDALDVQQVATLLRKFPRLVASPDLPRSELDGDRTPSRD
jgi:Leucine-rich repeat (LRR) protein